MDIKIFPRETVIVAKNYQSLIDWYIDNLNFKIVNSTSLFFKLTVSKKTSFNVGLTF